MKMQKIMKIKILSILIAIVATLACTSCSSESTSNNENNSGSMQQLYEGTARVNKSNEFYEKLLDSFLRNHFSKRWSNRSYIPNSITVVKYHSTDTHTDEIIGTFSFKEIMAIKTYPDKEFKATVHDDGDGKYHISFSRKRELLLGAIKGGWETIPSKPFEYTDQ